MKKSELKKVLMPIIKECIREAIFEEGVLSGIITEVAQGLSSNSQPQNIQVQTKTENITNRTPKPRSGAVIEAQKQLNEVKNQLSKATGLMGVFENTTPMASSPPPSPSADGNSTKYGALRDKDPHDPGVNIDGLLKMTGGWSHLTNK